MPFTPLRSQLLRREIVRSVSGLFLFIFLSISPLPAQEEAKLMDGYIVFGQSNANGRSYSSELSSEALRLPYDGNLFYAYRERSYTDGSRPVDIPLGPIQPDSRDRVGVEVTLGRHLSSHSPRPVLLVKFCSGGTGIDNFLPATNNLFRPMVAFLKEKEAQAKQLGYRVNWAGAFTITGESDCSEKNAPLFKERFLAIKAGLESELAVDSLPIVYSLLRGNWIDTPAAKYSRGNDSALAINEAMSALAENDPSVRVTPANPDLKTRFENQQSKTDGIHYSSDSYARLGVRLYRTAFPERGPVIDRNGNGLSDIWEAKHADPATPAAIRDKALSLQATDTDDDGISDWAEQQLSGFDAQNNDSFDNGVAFSDLSILLSYLDGRKPRRSNVSMIVQPDSPGHATGTLGSNRIDWTGPQHDSSATGSAIVTGNDARGKTIVHKATFARPQSILQLELWGLAKGGRVTFDAPFTVVKNSDQATRDGTTIIGNPTSDTRITILFDKPVRALSITVPGGDAVFFRFAAEAELPGEPLLWRK